MSIAGGWKHKVLKGFTGRDTKTYTAAGAISLNADTVLMDSTAGVMAMTLADGAEGQLIRVVSVHANNVTLTVNLLGADNTMLFAEVGDAAILAFIGSAWQVVGSIGAPAVSTV